MEKNKLRGLTISVHAMQQRYINPFSEEVDTESKTANVFDIARESLGVWRHWEHHYIPLALARINI